MSSLFPQIREALRSAIVKEQEANGIQQKDPLDVMDPQARINYLNELTKLEDQENKLRLQIDKVKKSKADLKSKYKLPL